MSITYNKTKSGGICVEALRDEIVSDGSITQTLEQLRVDDNFYIYATFKNALSNNEEAKLDTIIANHTCANADGGASNDDENDMSENDDIAVIQKSNSSAHSVSHVWENLSFDDTITLNAPNILNSTNNQQIEILQDGLYNIRFNADVIMKHGAVETYLELTNPLNDDVIEIPNSRQVKEMHGTYLSQWYGELRNILNIDIDITKEFLTGDIIKVKIRKHTIPVVSSYSTSSYPASDNLVFAELNKYHSLTITRMNGPQGPRGLDGKDGATNLTILKNGANKAYQIDKLNFNGNVTVTDNGNNKATITILGNDNILIHQIYGYDNEISEPMMFLNDTTRNKILSVESNQFSFGENTISNNDWFMMHYANDADCGYVMPYDGVITRITGICENARNYTGNIEIYVNNTLTDTPLSFNGDTPKKSFCTNVNTSFNKGDLIRLRGDLPGGGYLADTLCTIWVKWEFRIN